MGSRKESSSTKRPLRGFLAWPLVEASLRDPETSMDRKKNLSVAKDTFEGKGGQDNITYLKRW